MIMHVSRNEKFDDECIQHTMRSHPLKPDDRDASWSRCVMLEPFNVMLGTNALNTHTIFDHSVLQFFLTFHMSFLVAFTYVMSFCFRIFDFFSFHDGGHLSTHLSLTAHERLRLQGLRCLTSELDTLHKNTQTAPPRGQQ